MTASNIIVRKDWTPRQAAKADTKRSEFRKSRYTSGSANLDDMIATGKAVILCAEHTRKFQPVRARYRLHPAKSLRAVQGNCDVCQQFGLSALFINEVDAEAEVRKVERHKRAIEYGRIFRG